MIVIAKKLELLGLNILSFGWIFMAFIFDYVHIIVGIIVALSIAGLNIFKMVTEAKKWKSNKKDAD